jgi:hypothetical protein
VRAKQQRAKGRRNATTFRLDPRFQQGLSLLGQIRKLPLNRMVNEAVGEYLESRSAAAEADLEETLRRVRAYRKTDPNFEEVISRFAEAEAALAREDPAQGKTAADAFRTTLDLFDTGLDLMRQNLRRSHPEARVEEIERLLRDWLRDRPGAEAGDCPGRPVDVGARLA